MKVFLWNKYFATGIKKIDEQHKHLVDLINELGTLTINNMTSKYKNEALIDILNYTKYHFRDEESLMVKSKIDKRHIKKHIEKHRIFVEEIRSLSTEMPTLNKGDFAELFDYLINWLAYHILGIDQEMTRQKILIEDGMSPDQAYYIENDKNSNASEPLLLALKGLFKQVSKKNKKLSDINNKLEETVSLRTKELSTLNEHLEKLSYTDQLTGLKNRRFAIDKLQELWECSIINKTNLSCLMIDADNFKQINDNFGHDSGDIVIKTLADTLAEGLSQNHYICRLGGDEFLMILPDCNNKQAYEIAESVRISVNKLEVIVVGGQWNGSISIGMSTRVSSMKDYEDLIKDSDINVYESKRSGKNCTNFTTDKI